MIPYTTFQDAVEHALDYLGGGPSANARRDCIRAVTEAYRDLPNAHNWSYYYTQNRIFTSGAIDGAGDFVDPPVVSSIQYQVASGAYPRQVTLTGSTWPDWAAEGTYLRCAATDPSDGSTDEVAYRVAQRISATILTLDPVICPIGDLPAGTDYILYRDTYLLPEDYVSQDQALFERNFGGMEYTHPREWLYENRYVFAMGVPQCYTITGDTYYPGRLVLKIFPWPYENKSIDFIYKRRPRPLKYELITGGTVGGTAASNTITGTGTNFTHSMVGCSIRLSANSSLPTSIVGSNPSAFETVINGWVNSTTLTTQDLLDNTYSACPYVIGDVIDIEQGAMLNAYFRCVEHHLSMNRTLKDKPSARLQYEKALAEAKAADSRSFHGRAVGPYGPLRRRLRDYPINLNVIN
jgi:hypothetical protein